MTIRNLLTNYDHIEECLAEHLGCQIKDLPVIHEIVKSGEQVDVVLDAWTRYFFNKTIVHLSGRPLYIHNVEHISYGRRKSGEHSAVIYFGQEVAYDPLDNDEGLESIDGTFLTLESDTRLEDLLYIKYCHPDVSLAKDIVARHRTMTDSLLLKKSLALWINWFPDSYIGRWSVVVPWRGSSASWSTFVESAAKANELAWLAEPEFISTPSVLHKIKTYLGSRLKWKQ